MHGLRITIESCVINMPLTCQICCKRCWYGQLLAPRAFTVIGLLLASVALIVWFGVGLGLRPLLDLQNAIAKRTPSDLDPIRRNVPVEAQPIVATLNSLLERVSRRISSKDEFISSAAHQLRNPIAGVLALAEAVENAPTPEAAKSRSSDLVTAARNATHLTNQLLSFERARGSDINLSGTDIDMRDLIGNVIERARTQWDDRAVTVTATMPSRPVPFHGDPVMLEEAMLNLVANAVTHGGPNLSEVSIELTTTPQRIRVTVRDNGIGISHADHDLVMSRFGQANSGSGSGLGLPIALRVAQNHGGNLTIDRSNKGASVSLDLPNCRA